MAVNRVEEPGEGEAKDGSQEEHSNNYLLLHRCYKGHVWPEHVEDSQTQEEHTTKKMCPDVASLCVYSEDALEASAEGGHRRSVSMQQIVIIL